MSKGLVSRTVLVFALAIFGYANVMEAQLVEDGLVSYWPLDEETIEGDIAKDVWGENDGNITGNPKMVDGKIGGALEFNGAGDLVDIPGTDSLNFNGKSELTAAAWINVQGHSGSCCDPIVAQRDIAGWALRYDQRDGGAEIEFIVQPGWVGDGANFGAPVPETGEWHYVTGVLTGDQLLVYVDGELESEIAFGPGAIASAGTKTEIAGALDGFFMGIIDEVVIYEKALSEEEVKQNYQAEGLSVDPAGKLAVRWGVIKSQ